MNTENIQIARLLLNTCDAIMQDTYGASYAWKGVDMKMVLGELYDNYEYFELSLVSLNIAVLPASVLASHDKAITHYISGLCWENSYLSSSTNIKATQACLTNTCLQPVTTTVGVTPNIANSKNALIFRKSSPITDINIGCNSILTPSVLAVPSNFGVGAIYPPRSYLLSIKPIREAVLYEETSASLLLIGGNKTSSNATGTELNFNNINLKQTLGLLWDKFDYFTIELVQIQTTAISATVDPTDKVCHVALTGLPFVNCSRNVSSGLNTITANVGYLDFSPVTSSIPSQTLNSSINEVIFSKSFAVVDLNIKLLSISTSNLINITSGALANMNFMFKICPVRI